MSRLLTLSTPAFGHCYDPLSGGQCGTIPAGAFPIFESHSDRFGKPCHQADRLGRVDEALRPALKLEAYREVRFLPGHSAVTLSQ
jgi:hypothetical protein